MSQSTQLARVIVRQIIEAGITDAVISPGSRNAPLSLALIAAQERKLIKLHIVKFVLFDRFVFWKYTCCGVWAILKKTLAKI